MSKLHEGNSNPHLLMHEQKAYSSLMSGTWSGQRVAAAIAKLKDAGINEARIARLAGSSRATANRWARGANRPDHDAIVQLAAQVWRSHPDVARELGEASGYAWAEPEAAPEPPPVPRDVLAVMGKYSPERQREIVEMLQELTGPHGEAGSSPGQTGTGLAG
jgi:transcriptional regulator with XRE-family HTH domain